MFQLVAGAALLPAAAVLAWWSVSGHRVSSRSAVASLQRGPAIDLRAAELDRSARDRAVAPLVAALAARVRRLTPAGMFQSLEHRLAVSGMDCRWTIEQVLAAKALLTTVASLFAVLQLPAGVTLPRILVGVFAVSLGWFAPDVVLHGRASERRSLVQRELPDTMDQLTIAVEAGLGFDAALARVASNAEGVLASEIARTLQDIQLGVPRSDALDALSARCDLADLRHFVSAIRQAERYGLPIAHVLRIQSNELREKRRQRAEEQAMKLPVKVLFPLVFCILPTLFTVIIGPAVIRITKSFSG